MCKKKYMKKVLESSRPLSSLIESNNKVIGQQNLLE